MSYLYKFLFLTVFTSAVLLCSTKIFAQVEFVQNKGQWNNKVNYRGDFSTGSFFLENKGFTVLLHKAADLQALSEYNHGNVGKSPKDGAGGSQILHSFAYNVTFLGANSNPLRVPDKTLPTYNNYFTGDDRSKWASDCKIYTAVTYKDVYPNIDVRYYSNGEQLKYDFIIRPGGNPNAIALRYDGGVSLNIKNKDLIIGTSVGDVKELEPYSYATGVSGRRDIPTKYVLRDNVITFDAGKYDLTSTLVIDPQIIFVSLTGSSSDNWGYTATPGPDGSFFAAGISFGTGYPVSPGAYQTTFNGGGGEGPFSGYDIAIFKFSATGTTRLYATYLGGNGNEQPHSMITDPSGNLIVAGRSNSVNFPVLSGITSPRGGFDIVVTKFNAAGTALLGSVKLGGSSDDGVNIRPKYVTPFGADRLRRNYGDDARSEVILDKNNNIYLASCTQSTDFPTLLAGQATSGGAQDGVIIKFTPDLSSLLFSTYFGKAGDDACFVTAISPTTGLLYVGGATLSADLPGTAAGVISAASNGTNDGFVTQMLPTGGAFLRTTFIGTSGIDQVYGLKFDKLGFPYIMGTTTGAWPVTPGVFQNPNSKQFIAKMQPDLSAYIYSTVFGNGSSSPNISPIAFLVDRCENVYVSGWGGGLNVNQNYEQGNTGGLPEVNPLTGIPAPDGQDFYFFVLKKDATGQLFGSHFGQFGGLGDHVDGGTSRFDENGIIYQAICANCSGRVSNPPIFYPTTPGVWGQINGSSACNEAAVKIEMNFSGVGAQIKSSIDGVDGDTLGCVPLTVHFKDLTKKGVTYYWNFDTNLHPGVNDLTTTVPAADWTYTVTGTYLVRLISEDLNTCNQRDTSYITIKVGDNSITPKFTKVKLPPCTSTDYQFTNTSTNQQNVAYPPKTFIWNYGDGSPVDTTGFDVHDHHFPATGSYIVSMTVNDPLFCNAPAVFKDTIRIADNVRAKFTTPALGCAPYTAGFNNVSDGGLEWLWDFGDPASGALNSSTAFAPTHLYQNVGVYKVRLIALDSTTCNKRDTSAYFTITVLQKPLAQADWAPNPPEPNVPVRFSNFSQFSDRYLWLFGDGETSTEFQPVHEYNATGTYNAFLISSNIAGCTDTFPLIVNVIVNPLLDVPNAFTPGRFGVNSIVNVRGFGIGKMDWRIYNRWGQLIFQSSNKRNGWDGTYKGKIQPIDVYTYTLSVEFTDGKKLQKTGDITLLR